MRALVGTLLLLVLAGAADARPGARRDTPARAAEQRLRAGMPLMAVQIASRCLDDRPDDLACADVLGRAAAWTGRCELALPQLERVRAEGTWRPRSAISEGICRVRTEALDEALAAFDEAAWLDPADHGPWLQRALVDARLGRLDDLRRDAMALLDRDAPPWALDLAELWQAYAAGDPIVDALLQRHGGAHPTADAAFRIQVALVDCLRWLELGDPVAAGRAAAEGARLTRDHARLQACRAEAVRRRGDAAVAEQYAARPLDAGRSTPLLDAILARALVDQGRLDEAAAILSTLDVVDEPTAAASAWYLARARGDLGEIERLRRVVASHPAAEDLPRLLSALEAP